MISPKHANFIVNRGGATAVEVLRLIERVRERVREQSGVDLELEVNVAEAWKAGAGRLLIHGLYNNGSTFSGDRVGDLQVVSGPHCDGRAGNERASGVRTEGAASLDCVVISAVDPRRRPTCFLDDRRCSTPR